MDFMPGLELSRRFYAEAVAPRLPEGFAHTAALVGEGSEVLGFDTPMSMDHDWGARVQIFVGTDIPRLEMQVVEASMPADFEGYPASVQVQSLQSFLFKTLGFDPRIGISAADWLSVPEQKWLSLTAGAVFHDDLRFDALRERLHYYPADVWLFQLASVWERIGQEEHLVARAGYTGDELGASLIAARLVRDMMRLGFLFERRYAPYPKWFGRGFAQLACSAELGPALHEVLRAEGWQARDGALANTYRIVARLQNELEIAPPRPTEPGLFFDRPFQVIELHASFAATLRERIEDPAVRAIAVRRNIGGIDVFSDSTDLLSDSKWYSSVRGLYETGEGVPTTEG